MSRYGAATVAGDWPRSYEAQVRAGFVDNAIAQRAVKLVAQSVADAPLNASSPGLAALVAARSGGQALLETIAAQVLLHGNAFVQVLDDGRGGAGELFALRPALATVFSRWPVRGRNALVSRGNLPRAPASPRVPDCVAGICIAALSLSHRKDVHARLRQAMGEGKK